MDHRSRHNLRAGAWLALGAALLLLAGCRHPCGYVGVRAVIVPGEGEGRAEVTAGSETMRLTMPVSPESLSFEVAVESQEVTLGPGRRELYGCRSYVPYTWYAPLLKPIAAVTLVTPIYSSFHDPHAHGGRGWGTWDYCRDVVAWFNICSGVPNGPRKIETEERLIRSRRGEFPVSERRIPAPGRTVLLALEGKELARETSDAQGAARFDLASYISPEAAGADQLFRLKLQRENGTEEEFTYPLSTETAAAWLKAHPAP